MVRLRRCAACRTSTPRSCGDGEAVRYVSSAVVGAAGGINRQEWVGQWRKNRRWAA